MTVNKVLIPFDHMALKCDLCGSDEIVEEVQGYVCRDCGVVLTIQRLQYDRPYNNDVLQYSIQSGSTQLGTLRERARHPHSIQLGRLSKYNSQLSSKENVKTRAYKEISRISDCLSLPVECKDRVMDKFNEVLPQLQPRSKYRNPEKLSAIVIYLVLKSENIVVKRKDIVSTSILSKEEFNTFILQILRFIPEYPKRNRQNYVAQKILEITEHFGLNMSFYFLSRKILSKLWESIKSTTDDVIAGLCMSITILCNYKDSISVSAICDLLDVKMSTIQLQVKKRIFERFKLPGFVSLVGSSDLLRKFVEKVGLLEGELLEVEVTQDGSDDSDENIVSIKLGDGHQVFNPHNKHYLIGCVDLDCNKAFILCYLEVYKRHNHRSRRSAKKVRNNKGVWFRLTFSEYYTKKGPPLVNKT